MHAYLVGQGGGCAICGRPEEGCAAYRPRSQERRRSRPVVRLLQQRARPVQGQRRSASGSCVERTSRATSDAGSRCRPHRPNPLPGGGVVQNARIGSPAMFESPTPSYGAWRRPGSSFVDLLRDVAPENLPGAGLGAAAAVPIEIVHGTTVLAIRFDGGVVMAGDRRATAGYSIASRRIEKVFPADDFSGVAIAGAAGPGGRAGEALPGAARALREDRGRDALARGQGQPARPAREAATCPRPCRASWWSRCSPATTTGGDRGRVFSYDVTGGKYEEADFQTNGSGGVHARNWIKAIWREGMTATTRSTSRCGRSSPPPTRTPPPAAPTSCGASSRPSQ